MTDEEKKAIDEIRNWRNYVSKNKEKVNRANDIEFYLRTVLNLIQNLQEEKEKYKRMLAEIHAQSLNNSIAEKKKYEEQLEALNEGWKIELEKKDKMIDLMAIVIDNYDSQLVINSFKDKEDVKRIIEKKVSDGDD